MPMTARQRFRETMAFGRPDRVPWLEEGLRDDVLRRWREQGLPAEADLAALFHYDRRERIELGLGARPQGPGGPAGIVDLKRLRAGLDPNDPARLPAEWRQQIQRWRTREHILELVIHPGLLLTLGVGDWASLEDVLLWLAEAPDQVRAVMEAHGELAAALAERVLAEVDVDFASLSEPLCDNHGPLVSPATYRQIALASYRPVLDVLRRRGVPTIAFLTYGNARLLLPDVLAAGFNCLWAMETETAAMDYRDLRRQFGRSLRLIGGIDLDSLWQGEAAIAAELRCKVPALLGEGGYVPLADGRVRTNVPLAGYACYRRLLEAITGRRSSEFTL